MIANRLPAGAMTVGLTYNEEFDEWVALVETTAGNLVQVRLVLAPDYRAYLDAQRQLGQLQAQHDAVRRLILDNPHLTDDYKRRLLGDD